MSALAATDPPVLWWAARALGLLAYVAAWLAVTSGVLMAGKGAGGLVDKGVVARLHDRWSLVAAIATALHVGAIIVDPHAGVTPLAAIVPFASATLTGPVTLGTFALWGLAVLAASPALRRRLGKLAWRAVHATAFGTFVLALVHGLTAGSDRGAPLVRGLYLATVTLLLAAVIQRLLLARHAARAAARQGEHR